MADFETLKEMIIAGDEDAIAQTEKLLARAPRRATSSTRRCCPAWRSSASA